MNLRQLILCVLSTAALLPACRARSTEAQPPVGTPVTNSDARDDEGAISEEFRRFCEEHACRGRTEIDLLEEDGRTFHLELERAQPVVQGGMVSIYAGETIRLRAREQDGVVVDLAVAAESETPTIELRLEQLRSGENPSSMMLTVKHGFARTLKYRLGMMLLSDERVRGTSSCPVPVAVPSFELWPHPIFQLVLTDLRLVEDGDAAARTCE